MAYQPRPDGLPAMVMAFFRSNPEEELLLDDISEKFSATRGNIHTLLAEPLRLNLLARGKNGDGEWFYKAGPMLPSSKLKEENPKRVFVRQAVDIPSADAVVIEDAVPIPSLRGAGRTDWTPLLKKLQVSQSFALPLPARYTMSLAITELHKAGLGKFTMRTFKDTNQLRVWRTA